MSPLWEGGAKWDFCQPFKNPPKSPFAKGDFQWHALNAGLGPQPNQCSGFGFQDLGFAHMKLNGVIPYRNGKLYRSIPSIDVFGNIKFQAPNSK
jgi:hypothetical protein